MTNVNVIGDSKGRAEVSDKPRLPEALRDDALLVSRQVVAVDGVLDHSYSRAAAAQANL